MSETILASIIGTAIGAAIAALVSWFVTRRYYVRSSMELAAETARLRAMTNKVLEALEEAGLVKLTRDEDGRPKGIVKFGTVK